jgi:phenylalanyl-tRNA synthetase alpha chain
MAQINRDSIISELNNSLDVPLNETQIIEIRNSFTKKYLNPLYVELKNLPNEQKGQLGKEINELKIQINEIIDNKILNVKAISDSANHEVNYDISIETSNFQNGSFNPITMVIDQIAEYFTRLNFTIQSGEEVVNIKYGFDNLNVPISHPSRATSETFYVGEDTILRSQNTSSSAQFIDGNPGKDIRIMNYGYVYRNDDDDASHSHQFNQIDFV